MLAFCSIWPEQIEDRLSSNHALLGRVNSGCRARFICSCTDLIWQLLVFVSLKPASVEGKISCFLAEAQRTQGFIICDFSRELSMYATKVASTNTCKSLCVLCASARVNIFSLFLYAQFRMYWKNHSRYLDWYGSDCQIEPWLFHFLYLSPKIAVPILTMVDPSSINNISPQRHRGHRDLLW